VLAVTTQSGCRKVRRSVIQRLTDGDAGLGTAERSARTAFGWLRSLPAEYRLYGLGRTALLRGVK